MPSFVLALLIGCGPSGSDLPSLLDSAERKGFSGSIRVVHRGDVLADEAFGEAIRGEHPFQTDTVSSMGSLTKQFTGAAVLAAQEDGLLSVSDTLADHLEGVPPEVADITLHQLLTHHAGFPDSIGRDEDTIGRDAWLDEVWDQGLDAAPGEGFRYSNVGYGVAAAVLESATGTDYETFLRQRLLLPAGLEHTGYDDPSWEDDVVAHGYRRGSVFGPPLTASDADAHWNLIGNGQLLTTNGDMERWITALRDGEVLSDESLDTFWSEQVPGYSYGWGIEDHATGTAVEHDGSNGFYFAHTAWFIEEELFISFLANDHRGWHAKFLWDISDVVLTSD